MCLDRLEIKHDILARFDPRARFVSALLTIVVAVNVSHIYALAAIAALCLLCLCRDFLCVLKRLLALETFCLLFFVQSVIGILPPERAVVFILRVNCAALLYMLAVVPLGAGRLAQTLAALNVNMKLVSIFYLSHRYIYLMHDKVMLSIKAMRLRLRLRLHLRSVPRTKTMVGMWQCYAHVFATALAGAFVKTDEVTRALQKRGFDGTIPQTAVWAWRARDTVMVALCCLGCMLYGACKIAGRLFFL
jgi:energy-coupling factor transporter transmembrane protein EcfT